MSKINPEFLRFKNIRSEDIVCFSIATATTTDNCLFLLVRPHLQLCCPSCQTWQERVSASILFPARVLAVCSLYSVMLPLMLPSMLPYFCFNPCCCREQEDRNVVITTTDLYHFGEKVPLSQISSVSIENRFRGICLPTFNCLNYCCPKLLAEKEMMIYYDGTELYGGIPRNRKKKMGIPMKFTTAEVRNEILKAEANNKPEQVARRKAEAEQAAADAAARQKAAADAAARRKEERDSRRRLFEVDIGKITDFLNGVCGLSTVASSTLADRLVLDFNLETVKKLRLAHGKGILRSILIEIGVAADDLELILIELPTVASSVSFPPDLSVSTDVFLTHDWGQDELGRNNHQRVSRVNEMLKSMGIVTWFDEEQMSGNIRKKMTDGINNTKVVIVFVTERYRDKVNGSEDRDNCRYEFTYAVEQHGPQYMIPVVMETRMKNTRSWKGELGAALGNRLYVDLVDDDEVVFTQKCNELVSTINQLKLGGIDVGK